MAVYLDASIYRLKISAAILDPFGLLLHLSRLSRGTSLPDVPYGALPEPIPQAFDFMLTFCNPLWDATLLNKQ